MADIENHTQRLLQDIQANIKLGFETTNLRLASIEDKLSAENLYHLALRDEVVALKARLDRIEKQVGIAQ